MDFALQLLETILLTSMVILVAWIVNKVSGSKTGYRWRKILWFILAVWLIFPIPINIIEQFAPLEQFEVTIPLPSANKQTAMVGNDSMSSQDVIAQPNASLPNTDAALPNTNVTTPNAGTAPGDNILSSSGMNNSVDTGFLQPQTETSTEIGVDTILTALLIIWGVGVAVSIGIRLFQYRWLRSKYIKNAWLCEDASLIAKMNSLCNELGIQKQLCIMFQKNINSPMLFGYLNTIVFLPEISYSQSEFDSILRHELTHYKQKDLWYKFLMMFICDVYWFNPIYRLMKKMAYRDVECICDEKATKNMSLEDKRNYCNSILRTMIGGRDNNMAFTTKFVGNKKTAKQRLENILNLPNKKAGVAILSTLLSVMLVGTACVSFGVSEDETDKSGAGAKEKAKITIASDILLGADEGILNDLKAQYPDADISTVEFNFEEYFIGLRDNPQTVKDTEPTMFTSYVENAVSLGKSGNIADITDILKERGWLDQMNDSVKSIVSDENARLYGIPMSTSYAFGIVCNVEMFEAAGLVDEAGKPIIPQTWQELAETAKKIKDATGQPGLCILGKDNAAAWHFVNIAWNFGAELYTKNNDGSYTANLTSDEAVAAMEFVKSLKWDYDVLTADPTNEDWSTGFEHIGNGTAAMYIGASDSLFVPVSYGLSADKIALGAMPAGPSGDKYSCYSAGVFTFSPDASKEEINAALSLIEMMGMGPVLNDAAKTRIETAVSNSVDANAAAIKEINVWNNTELLEYEQNVLKEKSTTNQAFYESYFEAINTSGNLKADTNPALSYLYLELTDVLKKVFNDPEANIAELMKKANDNYQMMIDVTYE